MKPRFAFSRPIRIGEPTYVTSPLCGNPVNANNVYLVDLSENRKFRSNERVRNFSNGVVTEEPAPVRMDFHYLVSAWSPAAVSRRSNQRSMSMRCFIRRSRCWYRTSRSIRRESIRPVRRRSMPGPNLSQRRTPSRGLAGRGLQQAGRVLERHGSGVALEARYLPYRDRAGCAADRSRRSDGDDANHRVPDHRSAGNRRGVDRLWRARARQHQSVAGWHARAGRGAWVELLTPGNEQLQLTRTNALGRFLFKDLRRGQYQIRVSAEGLGELFRNIDVPSLTGEYDLQF